MFKEGILGMAAVFIGMALGYAYHFLMVRLLPPDVYGDLSLIIGILSILMVPAGSLQTILTREIAKLGEENKIQSLIKSYSKKIISYSVPATILFFLSAYPVSWIFNDTNLIRPLQAIAASIPFAYLLSVMHAYLRGKEKISAVSALMIIEPAIKLIATAVLVYMGFGLIGASASLAIAYIIPAIFLMLILWKKRIDVVAHKLQSNSPLMYILATNILLMVFLYLDLFAIKYFLGSGEAGFYNVANITAKVLMYAVGGITLVFLPKTSKLSMHADKDKITELVMKATLLMLPIFVIFLIFPKEIISLFYTSKYLSALMPFRILTVGMFAYALFTILLNLSWSQNREKAPLLISFIILIADAILLSYLVPAYGLTGAAIATTISSVFLLAALGLSLK